MSLKDRVVLDVADGHDLFDERLGDDVHLAVILVLHDGVALVGVQGDGKVTGQRPDRGRPNDEVELGLSRWLSFPRSSFIGNLTYTVVQGSS